MILPVAYLAQAPTGVPFPPLRREGWAGLRLERQVCSRSRGSHACLCAWGVFMGVSQPNKESVCVCVCVHAHACVLVCMHQGLSSCGIRGSRACT